MRQQKHDTCIISDFPSPSHLSDDDIVNLVMGVVRLLHNHATREQIERVLAHIREAEIF